MGMIDSHRCVSRMNEDRCTPILFLRLCFTLMTTSTLRVRLILLQISFGHLEVEFPTPRPLLPSLRIMTLLQTWGALLRTVEQFRNLGRVFLLIKCNFFKPDPKKLNKKWSRKLEKWDKTRKKSSKRTSWMSISMAWSPMLIWVLFFRPHGTALNKTAMKTSIS